MSMVLVLGGGLAGAAVAKELASGGIKALIAEKSSTLGGKVRGYGCKATDTCSNCGVCLTKNLWESVEENDLIEIRYDTVLTDLTGEKGNYTAALKKDGVVESITGITEVVAATGFSAPGDSRPDGFIEITGSPPGEKESIIFGSDIESAAKERSGSGVFETAPASIAFIQCFGSRDKKENAMYCSRVCCAYTTRAAKMIKLYYPDCGLTFFYMEMQQVKSGRYFDELKDLGIDFIKCRPVRIEAGVPAYVVFDDPGSGKRKRQAFDIIVLSDGIRPCPDAARVAEICGLGQTEDGFLKYVKDAGDAEKTGIYFAGCAGGPAKIEEVYAESISVAKRILFDKKTGEE